ncbi:MAG: hypothetical protein IJ309_02485 [Clostridia bacterium]|nr:hypothetical protein [Clostridia bacterium]
MKKVKIFIGSSIEELKDDRREIGNFFRQLNDLYLDNGVYFQLIMCEDYDDAIETDGKQSKYDKEILDSELSVFIFFKKVGQYTEHEFNIAYDSFKAELRPKILTVFKCIDDAGQVLDSVRFFADRLDKELKHYYKTYVNSDSLKLWLIMQIKTMGLDNSLVEFKDGKVLVGSESVASYNDVPAFCGNEGLLEKKKRLADVTRDYLTLKMKYLENSDDIDLFVKYSQTAKEKTQLEAEIDKLEKEIVKQLENIYTVTARGGLSNRQIIGYRLIEAGKYKEALEILNKDEIFSDVKKNEQMYSLGSSLLENARAGLETNVNEIKQRIKILEMTGVDKTTVDEVTELFATASDLCIKYNLDLDIVITYAGFLGEQKRYREAYELLLGAKDAFDKSQSWEIKARFYYKFGQAASFNISKGEALEYSLKALKIVESLCMIEETDEHLSLCADITLALSIAYGVAFEKKLSIEYGKRTVDVLERLYAKDNKKYAAILCDALRQYSIFIPTEQRAAVRKRSYEVLKPFVNDSDTSDRKKSKYAASLRTYVSAVKDTANDELEIERLRGLLQESISIVSVLAEKNPDGYSNELASCYYDYGDFLRDKTDESPEWYYLEAFCHYRKRIKIDERNTVFFYALSAGRVADHYMSLGLDILAYEFYEKQIWGKERLCDPDMGRSQRSRAGWQYDIGTIYLKKLLRMKEAALAFQKSIELYSTLPSLNDDDRMWIRYANEYLDENDLRKYLVE